MAGQASYIKKKKGTGYFFNDQKFSFFLLKAKNEKVACPLFTLFILK
jgi:hypothetical protein